jgi:hypothetical protein
VALLATVPPPYAVTFGVASAHVGARTRFEHGDCRLPRQWRRFSELAARINGSPKFHVATISGRTDDEGLGYRKRGLVVGLAEYLAGLQFDTVLVAGIPDMRTGTRSPNEQTRLLSLLYLPLSRAENGVQIFVNDEDGSCRLNGLARASVSRRRRTAPRFSLRPSGHRRSQAFTPLAPLVMKGAVGDSSAGGHEV